MEKILVTRSSMPDYEDYIKAIRPLWGSRWLTNMGTYHRQLERELTQYLKLERLSLFTNGHLALELALQAMNLQGEVITTPFTFASTTHAIVRNGLTPVFCDIDPDTYTMDVRHLEELITDRTSAIVPVHVYGNVCEAEEIQRIAERHGLKVIYDAAHAFGVEYQGRGIGTFGDASMFSFHATKVFHTIEGGAVSYRDEEFGRRLYQLKNFGIRDEETVDGVGSNAKMNEFQAIMGLCNLKNLESEIEKRKAVVERYRDNLRGARGIRVSPVQAGVKSNYAYFPILVESEACGLTREELWEELKRNGICARKYFYPLTNSFDCYKGRFRPEETPVAQAISGRVLTLPLYPDLEPGQVDRICGIIRSLTEKR